MAETTTEAAVEQTKTVESDRLGKCEVCNFNLAKYTCPKCEVKTCRIECLRIHKKELNCDGIRDKTKYIPMKQITESDLMSDYIFLESCTTYAATRRTDPIKRITAHGGRSLPIRLSKLKTAAKERNITLEFLLPNFDKHKRNTTFYEFKTKVIYWRIEWRFINADKKQLLVSDERCDENITMTQLISKHFENNGSNDPLSCFRTKGLEKLVLLLKAERIRKSQNRFFAVDLNKTLKENLKDKTIVEYPVVYVVYDTNVDDFDVIDSDEDDVNEETRKHKNIYFPKSNMPMKRSKSDNNSQATNVAANDSKPVNFLFSNENDEDDDDDEEEKTENGM